MLEDVNLKITVYSLKKKALKTTTAKKIKPTQERELYLL